MSIGLQQLQLEMQRALLSGARAPAFVHGSDAADRAQRFGIYATAYRSRLQDALAHNFPVLQTYLGEITFAALAHAYIDAHPSVHASIRAFGDRLAAWLERDRPEAPWLAELAHFEWLLGCAFDAPDDAALSMDALAAVEPEHWSALRFRFARSTQRATCRTNAPELYERAADDQPEALSGRSQPAQQWLIWRHDLAARYRRMTSSEALAFDVLAGGETFGAMCAQLLEHDSGADAPRLAAACLKRWLADGLIVTFSAQA